MSVLLPDPVIWCLLDNRAGNQNQCLGVANALNLPFAKIIIDYNHFGSFPNIVLGSSFLSLTKKSKNNAEDMANILDLDNLPFFESLYTPTRYTETMLKTKVKLIIPFIFFIFKKFQAIMKSRNVSTGSFCSPP